MPNQLSHMACVQGDAEHWKPMPGPLSLHLPDDLPVSGATRILDVGCGAGALDEGICQWASSAKIVGIDISPGMLAPASRSAHTVSFLMDGQRLAFTSHSTDIAILAFVLFHFPSIPAGIREAAKALRPGGATGTSTLQISSSLEAKRVWDRSLAEHAPEALSAVEDLPDADRGEHTDSREKLRALMEAAGLEQVATRCERRTYRWQSEEYLAARSSFGSSRIAFRSLAPDRQRNLIETVRGRLDRLPADRFRFMPTALCTVALVPT